MASGHDAHDDHAHDDGHDDHGHGHDDHGTHGSEGDTWVLAPLAVGLVLGIVVVLVLGLGTDVSPF